MTRQTSPNTLSNDRLDLSRLANYPGSSVAICWVMATHDLGLIRDLENILYQTEQPGEARTYLWRIYAGHIQEALKLIPATKGNRELMTLLDRDASARRAFDDLQVLTRSSSQNGQIVERIRNKGTFHYDQQDFADWVQSSVRRLQRESAELPIPKKHLDGAIDRVRFADTIFNSIFIHEVLGIDPNLPGNQVSQRIGEIAAVLVNAADNVQAVGVAFAIALAEKCKFQNADCGD